MGHMFVTASKTVRAGPLHLTSFILSPLNETVVSAIMTIYDATAATSNREVIFARTGTASKSVSENFGTGISMGNMYVVIAGGVATIVWN